MRFRVWVVLCCVITVACALLTAPAAVAGKKKNKPVMGGTLTALLPSEPANWDPGPGEPVGNTYHAIVSGVYDGLFWVDYESSKVIPRIATSFTSNADATVWTMKLRPNVKFTDGTPFDAAAVKFNWDRYLVPANAAMCRTLIAGWTSYVVVDSLTLRITLPASDASLPVAMFNPGATNGGCATAIASPAALAKYGAQYGTSPETTVGAGAFIMKEWVRGSQVTLVKNPAFWDAPRPYLDTINWRLSPADAVVQANAILSGAAHAAMVSPDATPEASRIEAAGGGVYFQPMAGGGTILINGRRDPLTDARVREALVLATDVKDLNIKAFATLDQMAETYYPKGSPSYDKSLKAKTNNLKAAQKLIDAYVAEKGGPVKFTIMKPGPALYKVMADALAQQWNRLENVEVALEETTAATVGNRIRNGDYDVSIRTINAGGASGFETFWGTAGSTNNLKFSDPTLDKLIAEGKAATSIADQAAINKKIVKRLLEHRWSLLVSRGQQMVFTAKNVVVTRMHDAGQVDFSTVWLSKKS
jgi:peptide/nickel transport system substrate-binding protein